MLGPELTFMSRAAKVGSPPFSLGLHFHEIIQTESLRQSAEAFPGLINIDTEQICMRME
jgi:hypothetical protein